MAVGVFSVPVFLVVFRETLEAVVVISVLFAFLKQTLDGPNGSQKVYKSLTRQVWLGAVLGFLLCLIVGGAVIGTFYRVGRNVWAKSETIYEGVFYLVAALIVTVVGAALLRVAKMQEKWRVKLIKILEAPPKEESKKNSFKRLTGKYALFVLAFITVSREGIEGIVFISGVSFSAPATSIPLPVVVGLILGCFVGWLLYRGGSSAQLQVFLIASTCLLYLVAAGLVARSVSYFEQHYWNNLVGGDVAETGSGPGSYDIRRSVWHVNCCSPEYQGGGGWGIFNGIFGWTNSATYSTVICYNLYWVTIIAAFITMRYHEVRGHWPLMKPKKAIDSDSAGVVEQVSGSGSEIGVKESGLDDQEKKVATEKSAEVSALEAASSN